MARMNLDRNGLQILSDEDCVALLATVPVGRVATSMRALPTVLPVTFVVDGDRIVFRSGQGKKLAAALDHNVVAFQADAWDPATRSGWSVLVVGTASPVTDADDLEHVRGLPLEPWLGSSADTYVTIPMVHVSGRRLVPADVPAAAAPTA